MGKNSSKVMVARMKFHKMADKRGSGMKKDEEKRGFSKKSLLGIIVN